MLAGSVVLDSAAPHVAHWEHVTAIKSLGAQDTRWPGGAWAVRLQNEARCARRASLPAVCASRAALCGVCAQVWLLALVRLPLLS